MLTGECSHAITGPSPSVLIFMNLFTCQLCSSYSSVLSQTRVERNGEYIGRGKWKTSSTIHPFFFWHPLLTFLQRKTYVLNTKDTQSSKSYMECEILATTRNRKEKKKWPWTVILISLLVMRSKLEITGAFFYHNLCAPNLWLHPTERHYLSGGVTQFLRLQDLSLGYPPALSHWPELLIKAVLRGASMNRESLVFLRLSVSSPLCCSRTFFPWKSGSATSGNNYPLSACEIKRNMSEHKLSECSLTFWFSEIMMMCPGGSIPFVSTEI